MAQAIEAIQTWAQENVSSFMVDVDRECEDEWSKNYAIIQVTLEPIGEYCDLGLARSDLFALVKRVFGGTFEVIARDHFPHVWRPGKAYLRFWGGISEIEAYRAFPEGQQ